MQKYLYAKLSLVQKGSIMQKYLCKILSPRATFSARVNLKPTHFNYRLNQVFKLKTLLTIFLFSSIGSFLCISQFFIFSNKSFLGNLITACLKNVLILNQDNSFLFLVSLFYVYTHLLNKLYVCVEATRGYIEKNYIFNFYELFSDFLRFFPLIKNLNVKIKKK